MKVKTITVFADGKEIKIKTSRDTIGEALSDKNIQVGLKDRVTPALDSKVVEKGEVTIKRAVTINLIVGGSKSQILSAEDSVEDMLKAEGISLGDEDRVNHEMTEKLSEGMNVEVTRVETKTVKEKVEVKFKEVVKTSSKLPNTHNKVITEGKNGEKEVTYSVVYEDGKEVSRKIVSEAVIKEPVDRVIQKGTYPLKPVSRGGSILPYSRVFKARATAYWAVRGVGKTYTASGRKAVRDPDGYSTIAVDPSVIPYGTKLFVEGYGFAIAADTGTSIKGEKIDVFFNTYKEACDWAVKYVNVYVLK